MTPAKEIILNSFLKLISEGKFEKVTVKQIIDDTDLSRQTFYYYFDNIENMIKTCIQDDTEEICKTAYTEQKWDKAVKLYIPFLQKYESAIRHSLSTPYFNVIYNALFDSFCSFYKSYIEGRGITVDENTKFLIQCSAGAFAGIVVKMVQNHLSDYDIMIEKLSRGINIKK